MPTYDYRCEGCGAEFEVFHGIKESPTVTCEKCGGIKTKRLLAGGTGLIFKGSGFYITDYNKDKSNGASAASSKESKPDSTDKSSKEKESKTDSPKSDSKSADSKSSATASKAEA